MATVKILLFTSKTLKDETHPVMLRVTKDRKRKYFSTGYSCFPNQWEEDSDTGGRFKNGFPNYRNHNKALTKLYWRAEEVLSGLHADGNNWTLRDFQEKFIGIKAVDFFGFLEEKIKQLKEVGKIGNAQVYNDTQNILRRFHKGKYLAFQEVDYNFLTRLEHFLRKNDCKDTTISIYMRTIRALFNKAIKEKCCKSDIYPFREYQISQLDHSTRKRALSKADIEKLFAIEPDPNTRQLLSKHLFMFSFYNMGMNFHDMAKLKWSEIGEERITYQRAKTKKLFSIRILPPVQEIIDFYRAHHKNGDFVFPILEGQYIDAEKEKQRIKSALKTFNKHLKLFSEKAGVEGQITSYVSRHSWATILKRMGVSTSIISEGLGHSNEKVTQIYLDSFENEVLDEINRKIL